MIGYVAWPYKFGSELSIEDHLASIIVDLPAKLLPVRLLCFMKPRLVLGWTYPSFGDANFIWEISVFYCVYELWFVLFNPYICLNFQ